jgi:hexosaminidase
MENVKKFYRIFTVTIILGIVCFNSMATALSDAGLYVIPYPQEVQTGGPAFSFSGNVTIAMDRNATAEDRFTAQELIRVLKEEFGINASLAPHGSRGSITLTRSGAESRVGDQGYQLTVTNEGVWIRAKAAAGLFYGTQTALQLLKKEGSNFQIPGLKITDWPEIKERAIHYDTKHHQDKKEYVQSFVRDMARFKINMIVWEWEDKLAYTSHPEIGAPGAFTIEEMQELTAYARKYHIELVPLVQGLGHVSFILKWPQYAHLREIPSSNWEFCPLKKESYDLLFDLWRDAIKATPGSRYIHIGSDETYELAMCDECKKKAEEIGKSGVYTLFVNNAAKYLRSLGREVMAWERPMGWSESESPAINIKPEKGVVLTESYSYEDNNFTYAKKAKALGYKVFAYDPNPGIEHIFLPYLYRKEGGEVTGGSLQESYEFLTASTKSGIFDGMISTSWDDSGLHNQVWMLRFATAAAFSWNGDQPGVKEFRDSFYRNYYGPEAKQMDELFHLFNDGALYYMLTFERRVWHWGVIGKTHLPDLPRGDAVEYNPYWNEEYAGMLKLSEEMSEKMERALKIIELNETSPVRNAYDFEVFKSMAKLILHTTQTYEDLSQLEQLITQAHSHHFESHKSTRDFLEKAAALIEGSLKRREIIFNELVATWQKVRLPKGLSTSDKKYFFRQDRARHFANRVPDMTYLIYDEQKLDMEGYLEKLRAYIAYYEKMYPDGK